MRDELEMREDYHARVRPDVLELVPDHADKVLDVGGGIGANVAHLKRMGKARFGAVADLVELKLFLAAGADLLRLVAAGHADGAAQVARPRRFEVDRGKPVALCSRREQGLSFHGSNHD